MEIQTVNINEQQLAPKPPEKSGHPFYILVTGILVIAALAGGWFAHAQFGLAPTEPLAPVPQPVQPDTDKNSTATGFYYLAADVSQPEDIKTKLYLGSAGFEQSDKLITTLEDNYLNILGEYLEPGTYVVERGESKVELLNIDTGKLELLFDIPPSSLIREVALSSDKKWLAYGINTEGQNATSEIWLYNIETKQTRQLVKPTSVGVYQGFSIEGWRDGDRQLVVSNLGGDAGQTWGEIALVSVETGNIEPLKVAREAQEMDFLRGSLSPNGDLWLYQHCEQTTLPTDAVPVYGCPDGTELRTYNLATKQVKTIYRNVRYEDNADRAILRTIMTTVWQDDRTVLAAVPGAVMLIGADGGAQAEVLFTFDSTNPQNFTNAFVDLAHATDKHVLFTRRGEPQLFDRTSKKILQFNVGSRQESFSRWLF